MRFIRKSIIGAAVAMALSSSAFATTSITFDPTGTAGPAGNIAGVTTFDWNVGNALSIGGNPATLAVGGKTQLLYQANLSVVTDGTNPLFTQGGGGAYFAVVANFGEVITSVGANNVTLGLDPTALTNSFQIYANTAAGDNLTGYGFNTGTPILSGAVSAVTSSSFTVTSTTPVLMDQFGVDNLSNQQTVTGGGSSAITITINLASVNSNYFPDLAAGSVLTLVFFTSEQKTPYLQGQPSNCFLDTNNAAGCQGTTPNLGPVNGLPNGFNTTTGLPDPTAIRTANYDFQFQADGSNSFDVTRVPEPGSLALFGIGLGALGFATRRKSKKA